MALEEVQEQAASASRAYWLANQKRKRMIQEVRGLADLTEEFYVQGFKVAIAEAIILALPLGPKPNEKTQPIQAAMWTARANIANDLNELIR